MNDDYLAGPDNGPGEDEDDEKLESLRAGGMHGISTGMKAILDALYAASEPMSIDQLAEETRDRVPPAVRYHARRTAIRRSKRTQCAPGAKARVHSRDVELDRAWRYWIATLVFNNTQRSVLLRHGAGRTARYSANPLKPPRLQLADGKFVAYTREQALAVNEHERDTTETHIAEMDAISAAREAAELGRLGELVLVSRVATLWTVEAKTLAAAAGVDRPLVGNETASKKFRARPPRSRAARLRAYAAELERLRAQRQS